MGWGARRRASCQCRSEEEGRLSEGRAGFRQGGGVAALTGQLSAGDV